MEVGDLLEARVVCTFAEQTSINVRHYRVSTKVGSGGTLAQAAEAIDELINSAMKAVMNIQAQYRGVGVRRIAPGPPTLEFPNTDDAGAGVITGDMLPTQTCGILTLRTTLAGKSFRGRFYAPFPSEASNAAGALPSSAYQTDLAALGVQLSQTGTAGIGGNTNAIVPVVFSRHLSIFTDIDSTVARPRWGTQRRRGSFGRPNPPPF